jgi:type IV pilus assembly protein PilQ
VGATNDSAVVAREPVFRDIVLSLKVTPQITAEGSVIMDIDVKREFPGPVIDGTSDSAINTRQAKTKVLVSNGQTAVIGGIYQSDEGNSESGIPVLKDIPVFGWLFKGKSQTRTKNELLVFLTPRILNAKEQGVVE